MNNIVQFLIKNNIKSVLDIGANVGDWANYIRHYIPDIRMLSIEANPECERYLKEKNLNYKMMCLSDCSKQIKFYIDPNSNISTGCSYYLENTNHFKDKKYIIMNTQTLDSVVDESYEYVKMDTQGSEIDIFKGGMEVINRCRFLQVETSSIEYNFESPLKDSVIATLLQCGFELVENVENHYMDSKLIQEDFIFINTNNKIELIGNKLSLKEI